MPFLNPNLQSSDPTKIPSNAKVIDGNDKPYLPVPGLTKLESVRFLGANDVLSEITYELPTNPTYTRFKDVVEPVFELSEYEGSPVLLRNAMSNHGIFQSSAKFVIAGDWADLPDVSSEEAPKKVNKIFKS